MFQKKSLGQHFLVDALVAKKIVDSLHPLDESLPLVEIGPGLGALTGHLENFENPLVLIEKDERLGSHLRKKFGRKATLILDDFLAFSPKSVGKGPQAWIGNLPYQITSPILFKLLSHRDQVVKMVAMMQHEVAERICAPPGGRIPGILSILLQAFFDLTYLFSLPPEAFDPPPKVVSAVVVFERKAKWRLDCDEKAFFTLVKSAFAQRRKTLGNNLKAARYGNLEILPQRLLARRAESLSVDEFVQLTQKLAPKSHQ